MKFGLSLIIGAALLGASKAHAAPSSHPQPDDCAAAFLKLRTHSLQSAFARALDSRKITHPQTNVDLSTANLIEHDPKPLLGSVLIFQSGSDALLPLLNFPLAQEIHLINNNTGSGAREITESLSAIAPDVELKVLHEGFLEQNVESLGAAPNPWILRVRWTQLGNLEERKIYLHHFHSKDQKALNAVVATMKHPLDGIMIRGTPLPSYLPEFARTRLSANGKLVVEYLSEPPSQAKIAEDLDGSGLYHKTTAALRTEQRPNGTSYQVATQNIYTRFTSNADVELALLEADSQETYQRFQDQLKFSRTARLAALRKIADQREQSDFLPTLLIGDSDFLPTLMRHNPEVLEFHVASLYQESELSAAATLHKVGMNLRKTFPQSNFYVSDPGFVRNISEDPDFWLQDDIRGSSGDYPVETFAMWQSAEKGTPREKPMIVSDRNSRRKIVFHFANVMKREDLMALKSLDQKSFGGIYALGQAYLPDFYDFCENSLNPMGFAFVESFQLTQLRSTSLSRFFRSKRYEVSQIGLEIHLGNRAKKLEDPILLIEPTGMP